MPGRLSRAGPGSAGGSAPAPAAMSYEQRRDWGRGRGRGRGGDGGSASAASSSAGGPGGRGRHPSHLKGREIGMWYARKQGQKNRDADRQQVRDAGTCSGDRGLCLCSSNPA